MTFERAPVREILRAAWSAALFAVIAGSLLPPQSTAMQTLELLPIGDKGEHFTMYAVLAFLPTICERRNVVIAAAAGAVALGVALEFAQLATGWRNFEFADMLADTAGVCLGLLSGAALRVRTVRKRAQHAGSLLREVELKNELRS